MLKGITYISAGKPKAARRGKGAAQIERAERTERAAQAAQADKFQSEKRIRLTAKKSETAKRNIRLLFCFAAGIVAGTIFLNFFCGRDYSRFGIFSEYFIDKFQNYDVKMKDLFLYSFWTRSKEMIFLLIISLTSFGCVAAEAFLFYKGLGIGILVSVYVLQYKAGGVFLYLLSVFPHYITYVIFVVMLVELAKELYSCRGEGLGRRWMAVLKCLFFLVMLNALTAYLETFVNLKLMKNILLD